MAVTLATLRTRVRQQADQESSTSISDSELNAYINQSARDLHALLSTADEDYFLTSVEFTLSTANTYSLPTNFWRLKGLDYSHAGDWVTVPRFSFEDRNKYQQRYQRGDLDVWRMYRVMQGALYILPDDDYAGTYRLWYLYDFAELASDSDQLSNLLGWDEYVVVDAAIKCLQKEESDASLLMARKAELKQRIMAEAANRDASGPERINLVGSTDDFAVDLDSWNR